MISRYYKRVARRQTTICCSAIALIALCTLTARAQTTTLRQVKQKRSADDKRPLSLMPLMTVWTLPLNNALTAPPAFHGTHAVFALEHDQLAAYDLEHGTLAWIAPRATTVEPAVGDDAVFIAEDESLTALALTTGDVVWTKPFEQTLAVAPVLAVDRLIIATSDGDVVALRPADGTEIWRQHLPAPAGSRPAFTDNRVFIPTNGPLVVALNLQNGDSLWQRALGGAGHDILADDERIFLGSRDRFFYCLDAKNGEVEWRWATGADAIGLPVEDDKSVYFVSLDNILRGLNRSSGVQRWKAPLPVRPIAGPVKYRETLVVPGSEPLLLAYGTRDGKPQGRYAVSTELSAPPYLFDDAARVFPVLATISSDIVGRATVTGATRDMEPSDLPLSALPNETAVPAVPEPPADLGAVSPLPNPTPAVPAAAR